jgi:hypothetical protein
MACREQQKRGCSPRVPVSHRAEIAAPCETRRLSPGAHIWLAPQHGASANNRACASGGVHYRRASGAAYNEDNKRPKHAISVAVLRVTTTRARSQWACRLGSSIATNGGDLRLVSRCRLNSERRERQATGGRQGQGRRKPVQRDGSAGLRTGQAAPAHRRPQGYGGAAQPGSSLSGRSPKTRPKGAGCETRA